MNFTGCKNIAVTGDGFGYVWRFPKKINKCFSMLAPFI
jgi:hypothetical protein